MHVRELAKPPTPVRYLQHAAARRYRSYALTGVTAFIFAAIWIHSNFISSLVPRQDDPFAVRLGVSRPPGWRTKSHMADSGNIPRKIWQVALPKKQSGNTTAPAVTPESLHDTPSWLAMNQDYTYTLIGEKGANEFVQRQFANQPKLVQTYTSLPNVGMKSDLLRYLMLGVEGGVYTDTDTVALKPVDSWVPAAIRDKVRLIVGIEFDRRDGGPWADIPHWLQFCQWTVAAAPGHPVFRKMVDRVLRSLDDLSERHGLPVDQLHPTSFEVMNSTGPAAWTDVVFQQLQEYDPTLNSTKDLSFMTEPRLYGDILVLTIDGFGMGQLHSHSTNDGSIPDAALVKHHFRGSWRGL